MIKRIVAFFKLFWAHGHHLAELRARLYNLEARHAELYTHHHTLVAQIENAAKLAQAVAQRFGPT